MLNVVDSSAWLEYLADGPDASYFAPTIQEVDRLLVSAVTVVEVFREVLRQRGESDALQAVSAIQQGRVVPVDAELALDAGSLGVELDLSVVQSIVLATARRHRAILWTRDPRLRNLSDVRYRPPRSGPVPVRG